MMAPSSSHWLMPPTFKGQGWVTLKSGLCTFVQIFTLGWGPKHLVIFGCLPRHVIWELDWKVKQQRLEPAPTWDVGDKGGGFTCFVTVPFCPYFIFSLYTQIYFHVGYCCGIAGKGLPCQSAGLHPRCSTSDPASC